MQNNLRQEIQSIQNDLNSVLLQIDEFDGNNQGSRNVNYYALWGAGQKLISLSQRLHGAPAGQYTGNFVNALHRTTYPFNPARQECLNGQVFHNVSPFQNPMSIGGVGHQPPSLGVKIGNMKDTSAGYYQPNSMSQPMVKHMSIANSLDLLKNLLVVLNYKPDDQDEQQANLDVKRTLLWNILYTDPVALGFSFRLSVLSVCRALSRCNETNIQIAESWLKNRIKERIDPTKGRESQDLWSQMDVEGWEELSSACLATPPDIDTILHLGARMTNLDFERANQNVAELIVGIIGHDNNFADPHWPRRYVPVFQPIGRMAARVAKKLRDERQKCNGASDD